jgi:hypothetical protein
MRQGTLIHSLNESFLNQEPNMNDDRQTCIPCSGYER